MNATDPPDAWLEEEAGKEITRLRGTCALGRGTDNDVPIAEPRASRRHAVIHAQAGEFWLVDLGSSNGTFLNGRRVVRPVRLQDNDAVAIAGQTVRFRLRSSVAPEASDATVSGATMLEIRNEACWLLVADLADFTTLSKRLPPDDLAETVGRWLRLCKEIIEQNGGTINKYLGDGFVAYWRSAISSPHQIAATLAALQSLGRVNEVAFRVAVHHGMVTLGGTATLGEESMMGPDVNFVFRLEKLAAELGIAICLSAAADAQLGALVGREGVPGAHTLKGFEGVHRVARLSEPG